MSRLALLAPIALVATLAAGCGGDDDTTTVEQSQARAAAERLFATHDARTVCADLVDDDLVESLFGGDRRACERSAIADRPGAARQVILGARGSSTACRPKART